MQGVDALEEHEVATLASMFSAKPAAKPKKKRRDSSRSKATDGSATGGVDGDSGVGGESAGPKPGSITMLDFKTANNLSIALSQYKRLGPSYNIFRAICRSVLDGVKPESHDPADDPLAAPPPGSQAGASAANASDDPVCELTSERL